MSDETIKTDKPKIGVYVCHCGGNISDVIDVEKVADALKNVDGVQYTTHYEFMCSDPGQNKIKDAIKEGKINRVVIAACSPRLHQLTFMNLLEKSGLNPYFLEQVNIREQASWVHKMDPEGATEKVIKLTKAAVEKVKLAKPLEKIQVSSLSSALILGGGVAGMRAAIDLADRGAQVYLVEKTPFLGGNTAKLGKLFPTDDDAKEIVVRLADKVLEHKNIKVYLNSEISDIGGVIGNFKITVKTRARGVEGNVSVSMYEEAVATCTETVKDTFNESIIDRKAIYMNYREARPSIPAIDWETCTKCGKCQKALGNTLKLDDAYTESRVEAGIILVTTGYEHYKPKVGEFGYGKIKNVITLPALIRILDEKGPFNGKLEFNGKKIKNIGFIHCVGSRQIEGVHDKDIKEGEDRRLNKHCSRVCCTATLQAENEIKEKYRDINIFDFYQDIRTYGRDHELKYYDKASKNGVLFFRYDPRKAPVVEENNGKIVVTVEDLLTNREEMQVELDMLVLSTGMVPADVGFLSNKFKLPKSADRFLQEMHPKLRPVETAIGGIYIAGTAQAPGDVTETTAMASAAAVKASAILEGNGVQLEPNVAYVDKDKCKGHGECIKVCPAEGAIFMNKENKAEVNEILCVSCGNCVAVCPERAVDIKGYEIKKFEVMVDAIIND